VYVPVVPVFRSILKPSSLLELSVQANWSWPALAWLCQLRALRRKKKIRMKYLSEKVPIKTHVVLSRLLWITEG